MNFTDLVKLFREIKDGVNKDNAERVLWDLCMDALYPKYSDYIEAERNGDNPDYLIDALFDEVLDILDIKD